MKEIKKMMEKLCEATCAEISLGVHEADTKELGEAIDMIKDLAEAEYYCKITDAMDEPDEAEVYGYRQMRRNYPKGRYGYNHNIMQNPYMMEYMDDPAEFRGNMKNRRMGYHDENMKYGKSYNDYKIAKRHYTETKSDVDKQEMNKHTNDYMYDVMSTVREMWDNADVSMRERMKADLQKLVTSLE